MHSYSLIVLVEKFKILNTNCRIFFVLMMVSKFVEIYRFLYLVDFYRIGVDYLERFVS
jgi:hypothetical protein